MIKAILKRAVATQQPVGTPLSGKVTYGIIASVSLCILLFVLYRKLRQFHQQSFRQIAPIQWIALSVYLIAIAFIFSAVILQFGFGINVQSHCTAGIYLCLVFYLSAKVVMYIFLAERLHIIHNVCRRRDDRLHLFNILTILVGFGTIAVLAFIFPVAQVSDTDGLCRIGIRRGVTIPLLVFDLVINIWLTLCFVSFVRPFMNRITPDWYLRAREQRRSRKMRSGHTSDTEQIFRGLQSTNAMADASFSALASNSLLGVLLVLSITIANLTLVLVYHGHEQGWVCFLLCSLDITWGVRVIHWMTRDSSSSRADRLSQPQLYRDSTGLIASPRSTIDAGPCVKRPPMVHIKQASESNGDEMVSFLDML